MSLYQEYKTITKECPICAYICSEFSYCEDCSNIWCTICDKKIASCPYCRRCLPNRDALEEQNKILILQWVFGDGEIFRRDIREIRRARRINDKYIWMLCLCVGSMPFIITYCIFKYFQ